MALLVKGCCSIALLKKCLGKGKPSTPSSVLEKALPWKRQPPGQSWKRHSLGKGNPLANLGKNTHLVLEKAIPWAILEKACTKLPWKRQIALERLLALEKV